MKRWGEFASERPELAEAGRALIYQFRVGLGYLATVRNDGGPRVHPVCPVIARNGLYVFVGNRSPKRDDLLRFYETYTATSAFTSDDTLFEFWLESVLHAKYGPRPSWPPVYTKWRSTQ